MRLEIADLGQSGRMEIVLEKVELVPECEVLLAFLSSCFARLEIKLRYVLFQGCME